MLRKDGIFGYGTNLNDRLVPDFTALATLVQTVRSLKYRIVLTQGKFNQLHYGHQRYLEKAREFGDFLVVGVDSDEKVRAKRGPDYPLIPHMERIEGLAHTRHVDAIFLKEVHHPHWALIKAVRPDVLIASLSTKKGGRNPEPPYTPEEVEQLKEFCRLVEFLPPQAEDSISARWRNFQLTVADRVKGEIEKELTAVVPAAIDRAIANWRGRI